MNVLVLNCGSSSLKFAVIDPDTSVEHVSGIAQRLGLMEREGDVVSDVGLMGEQKDLVQRYPDFARALDLDGGSTDRHPSGPHESV